LEASDDDDEGDNSDIDDSGDSSVGDIEDIDNDDDDDDVNPLLVNLDEETDQATKTKLWFGKVCKDKVSNHVMGATYIRLFTVLMLDSNGVRLYHRYLIYTR
jgi:hypothetical protein